MSYNSYQPPNAGGYDYNAQASSYAPNAGGFNYPQGPPPPVQGQTYPGQQPYSMPYAPPNAPPGHPPHPSYAPVYYQPPSGPPGPPGQDYQPPGPLGQQYPAAPGPPSHQYPSPGPPGQQYQQYPPQNQAPYQAPYGGPPQGHQQVWYLGTPIQDPKIPGSAFVPGYDPTADFEAVRNAMKGFGTDESTLISTLTRLNALQIQALSTAFQSKTGKDLDKNLENETSGWFRDGLHGLALGPLAYDAELVNQAIAGAGTKELLLGEVLLGRSSQDLQLLMIAYRQRFGRDLVESVRSDLSGKTERMFTMALTAARPPDNMPVNHEHVMHDVDALYKAGQGKIGTDEIAFCDIIINRSQPHLTALYDAYTRKHKSLSKVIKSEFSGHMRQSLLFIVNGAKAKHALEGPGVWRDAKMLEKAMAGMGTEDAQLVYRLVRAHWDRPRMEAIKVAYQKRYKKSLESRVAGETSGAYKKLMVALVNG